MIRIQHPDKEQLKAVLFDMDGVLYDSMKSHADTWMKSFSKYGITSEAIDIYEQEGRPGKEIIEQIIRKREGRQAKPDEAEKIYAEKTRLMDNAQPSPTVKGIREVINYLRRKNIKIAVVTGSQQNSLLEKLQNDFDVEPDDVVTPRDVEKGKPNPEPYLQGLKKTDTGPESTIIIENAPLGIQAARGAGVFTVALNTGILNDETLEEAGANVILKDGVALKEWFEKNFFSAQPVSGSKQQLNL